MTSPDAPDHGLLAPVRAGTAAETATGDVALLQAMLDAEAALTRAQGPDWAGEAVTAAARADRFDVRGLALRARSGGNPVIPLVAGLTAAAGPEAAPYVHRGATSQDIVDTATMLVAARTLPLITADLSRTAAALTTLAAEHRDTPMPGRTLTQHAVPTTFGLKAAGWRSLAMDATDRLQSLRLPVQLGGAAGTLAAFGRTAPADACTVPEGDVPGHSPQGAERDHPDHTDVPERPAPEETPRHGTGPEAPAPALPQEPEPEPPPVPADPALALLTAYAAELNLAAPTLPWHTLRTPVADLATALAFTCAALGKLATDVLTLSRTEIAELSEGAGGGSSAMPHKANPVRSTLIASAAHQAPALASVLLASLASAGDERPAGAWHAEWQPLRELLRLAGGAAAHAAELTENLRVHPRRMRENLDLTHGLIVSERVAAALAPALGRARAKELLTEASRRTAAEGIPLSEALSGALPPDRLAELTDPTHYTGSAAALVDRALERKPEHPHA
ncbi:adenylosuccinate lyase family protein [Streptomyces enissocaesilis]|uniref:Adenylosuccinate lyase C-terminal domain-containing protein n=1 Tax=Streptomyces enissocaesilis TaxID=332589 RepID=A0ABN3XJY6_9ACTN